MWPMPLQVDIQRFSAVTSGKAGDSGSWQKPSAA
jgi:hypothetical protein